MKHLPVSGILIVAALLFSGCQSNQRFRYSFETDQRYVTITTEPSDASVFQKSFVDDSWISLGKTPLDNVPVVVLTRAKLSKAPASRLNATYQQLNSVVVRIEKDGYETYGGPLRTDPSETVEHHIRLTPEAR